MLVLEGWHSQSSATLLATLGVWEDVVLCGFEWQYRHLEKEQKKNADREVGVEVGSGAWIRTKGREVQKH